MFNIFKLIYKKTTLKQKNNTYFLFQDCPLLPPGKDKIPAHEETFLRRLYNYMRDNNTPIGRIPTLGFKEGKKSPG